jgi:DNA-directed RNA polymerase specialized sigma subunit
MNIHRSGYGWDVFAIRLGYKNIQEMLHYLYITQNLNTKEVGDYLGIGKDRAAQLLRRHGIPLRSRGGAH